MSWWSPHTFSVIISRYKTYGCLVNMSKSIRVVMSCIHAEKQRLRDFSRLFCALKEPLKALLVYGKALNYSINIWAEITYCLCFSDIDGNKRHHLSPPLLSLPFPEYYCANQIFIRESPPRADFPLTSQYGLIKQIARKEKCIHQINSSHALPNTQSKLIIELQTYFWQLHIFPIRF